MKLKSVREAVDSLEPILTEADAHSTEKGYAPIVPSKQLAENTITQDRQHTKEVLMGRVREVREAVLTSSEEESAEVYQIRLKSHNAAIDQALQIIGEVFNSE